MTLDGEVIGVVNAGGGENLAFAISAALVERVVPSLIENGEYNHAYLGIVPVSVTPSIAERFGLDKAQGVYVKSVKPNSPASGVLDSRDVIIGMGNSKISTRQQLTSYLALQTSPGDSIQITLRRNGSKQTVSVTLGQRPEQSKTIS